MTLDSFDVVFYTAGFLVPGFIWSAVLSMLVPRRASGKELRFLEVLTLSGINYGLWSWAWFLIFKTGFAEIQPYWTGLFLAVIILVSPAVLGIVSAGSQHTEAMGRILGRLGFYPVHPTPTAWDWHFSRGQPAWVLVTLLDGTRIHGLYGLRSFAGDDPERRDLFLQAAYRLLETGEWAPVEETAGVWISGQFIVAVEFRKVAEVPDDQ